MKRFLFILLSCCIAAHVYGQNTTVGGKVLDDTGQPLAGATIKVKDGTASAASNGTGNFTITVPDAKAVLVVSYLGYETREYPVNGSTNITITLNATKGSLEEVVVVGYGQQKKVTLTGAVSAIKGSEITTTRNESVTNMLTGKLPGVRVVQKSSEPGAFNNQFDIRGYGDPLVVIDGVPRGNFERLDPNDIESISVLKDASAAVYGVQAANGVVLITTKKGAAGKTLLSYEVTVGQQRASGLPKPIGALDWMTLRNEKQIRDAGPDANNPARQFGPAQFDEYLSGAKQSTDWYPIVLRDQAPEVQHSLTASGGSDKVTYYISAGYFQQGGLFKSKDLNYEKYNLRANLTAKISNSLTADLQISGISDTRNRTQADATEIFKQLWRMAPVNTLYANNNPGQLIWTNDQENPLANSTADISGYRKDKKLILNSGLGLTYQVPFITGLRARAFFAYDYTTNDNKNFVKTYTLYNPNSATTTVPVIRNSPSTVNRYYDALPNTLMQYSLNYNNRFAENHNVEATLFYEERTQKADNFNAQRELVFATLDQLGGGNATNQIGTQNIGGLSDIATKSFIGKLHYDYKSKYLIDFAGRYDGSSRFSGTKQWGFFPSVSAGYRISEESFIKENESLGFLSDFKLRGSYGETGDAGALSYQFLTGYDFPATGNYLPGRGYNLQTLPNGSVFGDNYVNGVGFRPLANTAITWSRSKTLDIGVDMAFFNSKLTATVDWFRRDRKGLLATRNLSLPGSLGATLPQENLNSDRQQGWEVILGYNGKAGNVGYTVSGNISYTRRMWLYNERAVAGNSYQNWRNNINNRYNDVWFGYGEAGRFQSFNDIYGYNVNQGGGNRGILPGDYKYEDWNNDGFIDDADRYPVAATRNGDNDIAPPLYNFGLNLGVNYKGFDLNALIQGAAGKWISYPEALAIPLAFANGNALEQFMDRWHPADAAADPYNPNTQYIPGRFATTGSTYDANSLFAIQNAAYVRLKTITLGYSLPVNLIKRIGLQRARIYVNGYNLLTISGIKDVDAEHPADSFGYVYPLNKTYNLGINVGF
jgi:TonB-linked SusC/RagA family outer membrane protein